ncbi:phospholipase A2, membrane associated-like [Alligator sinensis]|uniref:Phospholipase A2 n=1 Tax=Alligator sinensis TaxID=38654 RepID=A0A1U7S5H0_ALLSI|nr:phospholipase A2, membrane associated-like [Alligator sinensis]
MKHLFALSVLFAFGMTEAHGNLWQLQSMIEQVTGKNAILDYAFYGCYCGLGGKGRPKDPTDRCCEMHDSCYSRLKNYSCFPKKVSYKYYSSHGSVLCGYGSWCTEQSCDCDKRLVLCLKKNLYSYNKKYRFYLKMTC